LTKDVRSAKRPYTLGDVDDFELHAGWMIRPIPGQGIQGLEGLDRLSRRDAVLAERDRIRREEWSKLSPRQLKKERRAFRETEPYVHLTRTERSALVDQALTVVGTYSVRGHKHPIALFAEAINKERLPPGADPVDQAFTQVVSRFERFLQNQGVRGRGVWGLLVSDEDQHRAKTLTNLLRRFQSQGTQFGEIAQIIEAPFFLDSRSAPGVQVVDLCAYALRRYLEKGEEARFRLIFDKFYRTATRLHGLRHYTAPGCPCIICRERGHD
jgi:hypothetical protein